MEDFKEVAEGSSDSDYSEVDGSDELGENTKHGKRTLEEFIGNKNKRAKLLDDTNGSIERQKKTKSDLYKPPTTEEFKQLRDTESLFKSNLFSLQISELLKEIKVKDELTEAFDTWFKDFKKYVENLPEHENILLSELIKKKAKSSKQKFINCLLEVHKSYIKSDHDVALKFIKPQQCSTFGLHTINASIGPKLTVNVNMAMPKRCFLERDYLNNRYIIKRDYYSSYIYYYLKQSELCSSSSCIHKNSILLVIPQLHQNIEVYVHITPADDTFKLSRFEPGRNNIRENLFNVDIGEEHLKDHGTPFYNSIILNDLTLLSNYKFAEISLKDLNNVQDGIKVLIVWLRQRKLLSDNYGFTENLLIQTIVYLVLKRKLNKYMSSYQVIRNFWVFLSTSDWHQNPTSICENVKPENLKRFSENFEVVFLDKSGSYNLATFLYLDVYLKIKAEAKLAVEYLDNVNFNSFTALFMTKMDYELQYDAILILKDSQNFQTIKVGAATRCKYIGCFQTLVITQILALLNKALNKRVTHIVPLVPEDEESSDFTTIKFGLNLDLNEAFSQVVIGPPANSHEAAEFRHFWGKLSECRRFADGSICEAVLFPTETMQEKRKVFKRIVEFVVKKMLKIEELVVYAHEFENTLVLKNYITPFPIGTGEEASLKVISVFDELCKKLRLCNLPLEITSIQGVSELFSYTSVFPPIATNYRSGGRLTNCKRNSILLNDRANFGAVPKYVEPIECVIQLGMNSKWPHDLQALKYVKIGFYIDLSKKLFQEFQIISDVHPDYLKILYQGLVFRYRLYNPREISELKKVTASDGMTSFQDTEESLTLEKNLFTLPRIVGALHGIHSSNPSFGPSTCLIKRWLRSQLIDEYHIPDIVVDLLNAAVYLNSAPYNSAALPQVAFLRFLKHVAELDWETQFIVVNFNDEISEQEIHDIDTDFQQNRHVYPALFLITSYDKRSIFSRKCLKEVLWRFSLLAKHSYEIAKAGIPSQKLSVEELFIPNLDGYDVVIHLKSFLLPRRHQQLDIVKVDKSIMNIEEYNEKEDNNQSPVVGFNPVDSYLRQLRENYGSFALFFYDSYGGHTIGVLWHPKALEKKDFKVSSIKGRKFINSNLMLDTDSIIEGFYVLGKGLVKEVLK